MQSISARLTAPSPHAAAASAPAAAQAPAVLAAPATAPTAPVIAPGPIPTATTYDLTLNPAGRSLSGSGTIAVTNQQKEPLTELYVRLWANTPKLAKDGGAASITGVKVDGAAVAATQDRTLVRIPLATPLAAGASTSVSFDLSVTIPSDMGRMGTARDGSLYFGNALPMLAVHDEEGWNLDPYVGMGETFYSLASDWQVTLRAPEPKQLITTGTAVSDSVRNGQRELVIKAPHARDFIIVATEGYKQLERQVGDTKVRVWTPAGDGNASKMLDTAAGSLDFYNKRYGAYDQPEMDVIATRGLGGGMEYPGVTLNDGGARIVVAHENAHQWFYSMAGNNQFDDPWLDESFTTFITSEYTGASHERVTREILGGRKDITRPAAAGAPPANVSSPMHVLNNRGYFGKIYSQGANVLGDLKKELGEETFVKGMRTHFEGARNGVATTAGFITTMSGAAGRDLTDWFVRHNVNAVEPAAADKLDPNRDM